MARVVVRSELGTEELELLWGARASVKTRGTAEILVEAAPDAAITLDRRPLNPFRGAVRGSVTASLPPALVVGARRVEVREGRRTALLDLSAEESIALGAEFRSMVETVESDLSRVRGPFWYLDHERRFVRAANPTRIATFLLDHLRDIEDRVQRIAVDPSYERDAVRAIRPGGPRVDVAATLALIRRRPELLEPTEPGVVNVAGLGRSPSMVVLRRQRRNLSTPENRRLTAFLRRLWGDCRRVERTFSDLEISIQLREARDKIGRLLHETFLREVAGLEGDAAVLDPIGAELQSDDYKVLHGLRVRYLTTVNPGADVSALERQHVAGADEIFQAFVCYLIAEAFDLDSVGDGLRDRDAAGASFRSSEWELFYDIGAVIGSWRSTTIQPDDYRPDIVLRRVTDPSRAIVLDVKFSVDEAGRRPPNARLKEIQAYMQSFTIPRVGLLFPGDKERAREVLVDDVAAHGNLIREIPVRGLGFDVVKTVPSLRQQISQLECSVLPV
jgi:hypothetical protein